MVLTVPVWALLVSMHALWSGTRAADFAILNLANSMPTLSCGSYHNCILNQTGYPICWGRNSHGQTTVPGGLGQLKWLSAGFDRTCGITLNGTVECWGNRLFPLALRGFQRQWKKSKHLSTGKRHSCSIQPDGATDCWGWGDDRVGVDGYTQARIPAHAGVQPKFSYVSASYFHTCGLETSGHALCWGRNDAKQAEIPSSVMVGNVQVSVGLFTTLATGKMHTCGVQEADQKVLCWGENKFGQANYPEGGVNKPYDLGQVTGISAGDFHTCVVTTGHTIECWGWNGYGQCDSPAGNDFVLVSSGSYHSCGMQRNGAIQCWGFSSMNQAGVPRQAQVARVELNADILNSVSAEPSHLQAAPPVMPRDPFWFA